MTYIQILFLRENIYLQFGDRNLLGWGAPVSPCQTRDVLTVLWWKKRGLKEIALLSWLSPAQFSTVLYWKYFIGKRAYVSQLYYILVEPAKKCSFVASILNSGKFLYKIVQFLSNRRYKKNKVLSALFRFIQKISCKLNNAMHRILFVEALKVSRHLYFRRKSKRERYFTQNRTWLMNFKRGKTFQQNY